MIVSENDVAERFRKILVYMAPLVSVLPLSGEYSASTSAGVELRINPPDIVLVTLGEVVIVKPRQAHERVPEALVVLVYFTYRCVIYAYWYVFWCFLHNFPPAHS